MELTPIELENNLGPDANGDVHRVPWVAYDKDEVDQLIAEKDKEIAQLKADLADLWDNKRDTDKLLDERNAEIARLKQGLTDITSASAMNDDIHRLHITIRKLLSALWTVRMKFMWSECRWFSACNLDYIRNREGYTPNSAKEKQMGSLQWARLFYKNYELCKRQVEKFNSRR